MLLNLNLSKKQRRQQIQDTTNGIMNEMNLYLHSMLQRLKIKTLKCKANMQGCIILSELLRYIPYICYIIDYFEGIRKQCIMQKQPQNMLAN